MLDRFDHDELLAYIEGELAPEDAVRLEHELANLPRAAMQVERLRRDRELLRGDREPALPRNFLSSIESRLARPMLMETLREVEEADAAADFDDAPASKPGAMRRKRRQRVLRQRLMKLAIAAIMVLGLGAGIWALTVTTNLADHANDWLAARTADQSETSSPTGAMADRAVDDAADEPKRDDGEFAWPDGAIVHHAPQRGSTSIGAATGMRSDESSVIEGDTPALNVLLVVQTDDPAGVESSLAELVSSLDMPAALVQNFGYEEASQLAEAWARQQGGTADRSGRRSPRVAGMDGQPRNANERLSRLAEDARRQLHRSGGAEEVEQSRQLAGARTMAASFTQQLDYSSRGATHTITIPAGKLHEVLAALDRMAGMGAMLVRLPEASWSGAADLPLSRRDWLTQRREVQELLAPLDRMAAEAVIHLPVRVEQESDRERDRRR